MTANLPTSGEIAVAVRSLLEGDGRQSLEEAQGAGRVQAPVNQGIVAVYLFGSFARGEATPASDVDLGLLYAEPPSATLLGQPFLLEAGLAELLRRPVQCVVMNAAPVDLVHRILSEQTLLFDSSPSLRIRFEVQARNQYFDLKPFLDRYRKVGRVA